VENQEPKASVEERLDLEGEDVWERGKKQAHCRNENQRRIGPLWDHRKKTTGDWRIGEAITDRIDTPNERIRIFPSTRKTRKKRKGPSTVKKKFQKKKNGQETLGEGGGAGM